MKKIALLCVGRLKQPFWQEAAEDYRRRLSRACKIEEISVKDADPALETPEKIRQEGERILASLPKNYTPVCLDERGERLSSVQLANWLRGLEDDGRPACFIVGGAYGLSDAVRQACRKSLSLGPLTFPHELAQVILWEQLFRADSIQRKTGYHHD